MYTPPSLRAASAYKTVGAQSSVDGADAHQLIVLLFDGLLQSVNAARGALSRFKTVEAAREALDGGALPDLRPTAKEAGWPGLLVSEEHGGAGQCDHIGAHLVPDQGRDDGREDQQGDELVWRHCCAPLQPASLLWQGEIRSGAVPRPLFRGGSLGSGKEQIGVTS